MNRNLVHNKDQHISATEENKKCARTAVENSPPSIKPIKQSHFIYNFNKTIPTEVIILAISRPLCEILLTLLTTLPVE